MSLGHPAGVPAKRPFFVSVSVVNNKKVPGTLAGRSLFVPPSVAGIPGRCSEDFSYVCVPLSFLTFDSLPEPDAKMIMRYRRETLDFMAQCHRLPFAKKTLQHALGKSVPKTEQKTKRSGCPNSTRLLHETIGVGQPAPNYFEQLGSGNGTRQIIGHR